MSRTELMLRDSLALEGCKTEREFAYVTQNIEARHAVEGISDTDLRAWEAAKAVNAVRIARVMAA